MAEKGGLSELAQSPLFVIPPKPARYTIDQWYLSTRERYRITDDQHRLADRVISDVDRVIDESADVVLKNRRETDHQLDVKIKDIEFLKGTLEMQKKDMDKEIEALITYKFRIQACQKALTTNALETCQKCIALREARLGMDLCEDDVEVELFRELEIIQGVGGMVSRLLEEVKEQIRRLRAFNYTLKLDLRDKGTVLETDRENYRLKETSLGLATYHGQARLDPATITNEEWLAQSQKNIEAAARELLVGKPLRAYVDTLLAQIVEDLRAQYQKVNRALERRVLELRAAKTKLEDLHFETVRQSNEVGEAIYKLKKAIQEKECFMALAHTRLGNRCQRVNAELCRDEAESYLVNEVLQIREVVKKIQQSLLEAEASQRYLLRTQVQLEEDINVKMNSLKIDEVDCMTLRKSMDYQTF